MAAASASGGGVLSVPPLLRHGLKVRRVQWALTALQKRTYQSEPRHSATAPSFSSYRTDTSLTNHFHSFYTPRSSSLPRVAIVSFPSSRRRYLSSCSVLLAAVSAEGDTPGSTLASATKAEGSSSTAPCTATSTELSTSIDAGNGVGGGILETSAQAKWAVDAAAADAVADTLTELPAQSDLVSLGLCANTPVGWLQSMIEFIHVQADLPWWAAIVVSTFLLRAVIFPVVMKIQKNGVIMNNINPQIQKLMKKQREYRQAGNKMLSDQYSYKIWSVYQKHNCNPLKMAVMPLIQLPLFLSFFIAIRKMAAVPVESMKTGGMLWFQDLTVADPYYILPVLACGSFVASIELGGETGVGNPQTAKLKNVFRLMPIILIPITASFPAGLFMYWLPASFISIAQIMLLRVQRIRSLFGIPQIVQHPPEPQEESKGVFGYFKESYSSSMAIAEAKQRKVDAEKKYKKLKKNPRPKLYDRPPHLMKHSE